jgi:adenylate cyclase class 2
MAVNRESPMGIEIEAKFRLADPKAIRRRLDQLGVQSGERVLETNRIFDTPDERLRNADCGLRIRQSEPLEPSPASHGRVRPPHDRGGSNDRPALLTYKGPRRAGDLKSREELETAIGRPATLIAILERLGFRQVIIYQKRRQTWHLGECEVALDELPRLGWWLEIEGLDAAVVEQARDRLGLADAPLVRETYVEMAAAHGRADAGGCRWLVFDAGAE